MSSSSDTARWSAADFATLAAICGVTVLAGVLFRHSEIGVFAFVLEIATWLRGGPMPEVVDGTSPPQEGRQRHIDHLHRRQVRAESAGRVDRTDAGRRPLSRGQGTTMTGQWACRASQPGTEPAT